MTDILLIDLGRLTFCSLHLNMMVWFNDFPFPRGPYSQVPAVLTKGLVQPPARTLFLDVVLGDQPVETTNSI